MNADNFSAIPGLAVFLERTNRVESGNDLFLGNRHSGGQKRGNAILGYAARHLFDTLRLCVASVLAEIAVDVDINESGGNIIACGINNVRICGKFVDNAAYLAASVSNARILPHTTESGRTILPLVIYVSAIVFNSLCLKSLCA